MRIIKADTALAALSELRTRMDEILAQLRQTPVVLEKHRRPVAVLVSPARFEEMQRALESACDIMLAYEARRRESGARAGKRRR